MSKTDTMLRHIRCFFGMMLIFLSSTAQKTEPELYRPQLHFSPAKGWMNDPNGLVYFDGIYHLFFQYYPDSTVWGPMHWGHAVSRDLTHWKETAIALSPDSIGYIFSGSVVMDSKNSSGLGRKDSPPLVAIFTQHNMAGEKANNNAFQNQSIAYSLDKGYHWIKFDKNPVLRTPGLRDFRDPKVIWFDDQKKWIMVLAAGQEVLFYSSTDLITWKKESAFGSSIGAHGGVWECPDLIPFVISDKKIWLLIVSINPGGAQGGSSTQYFTGSFDGSEFKSSDTITRWFDYGTDNYASVSYSNTGKEKIVIGWMSNWQYGQHVPTGNWRSAMTFPRNLSLAKAGNAYFTTMQPVPAWKKMVLKSDTYKHLPTVKNNILSGPSMISFSSENLRSFTFIFSNSSDQELRVGYDEEKNSFFVDRSKAGKSDFNNQFARIYYAPRIAQTKKSMISMLIDESSLELFADDGLTVMTEIFFPDHPYKFLGQEPGIKQVEDIRISQLSPFWNNP